MPKGYHHLTYSQRCQILVLKERGESQATIAQSLKINRSTVCRELNRNSQDGCYGHDQAHYRAQNRKKRGLSKANRYSAIFSTIEEKIKWKWSPEQVSGWLKKENQGSISHETIYKYIWKNKKQGGGLYLHLRHQGKKYNKRGKGTSGRGCIPGRIDIKERPVVVEEKSRIGDWELDTIIGGNHNGAIVSMVDRASKLTKLVKVSQKTAEEVGEAIVTALRPLRVLTLTADNGKEFARHQMIRHELGATVYFSTPYHSWERGLNEHTNGLVRQYFPKGLKFEEITQEEVEAVEWVLNNRPRKILSFETPQEVFQRLSKN